MSEIDISIKNVKNIKSAQMTFPFEKGMYALVGENACGKSTIMLVMSLMVKSSSAHLLSGSAVSQDTEITISADGKYDRWYYNPKRKELTTGKFHKRKNRDVLTANAHFEGFYEGSIFYGCRFDDYNVIDSFLKLENYKELLVDADPFVTKALGYILHDNENHYRGLKRIISKQEARKHNFNGVPYFIEYNGDILSQFKMSSGESMLISLIDFLNNLIIKNPKRKDKLLFLIDEVELALHPGAIDRLVLFLNKLIESTKSELIVFFSTHSAELIHRIPPHNIYLIENENGSVDVINPCYPNYAIRSLYIPNGFDFVLLVEDELTKAIVQKVILSNNLTKSKLICILPAGGCNQMLSLHRDMVRYNTLGTGKHIISIYDGDVKSEISKRADFKDLPKCFLPIPSVEKYIKKKFVEEPDSKLIKIIGDKYFPVRSLREVLNDYLRDPRTKANNDRDGKNLFKVLCSNALQNGITQDEFIKYLAGDILEYENPTDFVKRLSEILS
ncbi:MAG: ATP-binding protein [Oscillospiraceae bacterium]|nr:ATP-binding protein [Oscillospiraceae bacterium]